MWPYSTQRTNTYVTACKRPTNSGPLQSSTCHLSPSSRIEPLRNGYGKKIKSFGLWSRNIRSIGHWFHNNSLCHRCSFLVLAGEHLGNASNDGSNLKDCQQKCPKRSTFARTKVVWSKPTRQYMLSSRPNSSSSNNKVKHQVSQEEDPQPHRSGSREGARIAILLSLTACGNLHASGNQRRTNKPSRRRRLHSGKHMSLPSQATTFILLKNSVVSNGNAKRN